MAAPTGPPTPRTVGSGPAKLIVACASFVANRNRSRNDGVEMKPHASSPEGTRTTKRPLTQQKLGWISAILKENRRWSNAEVEGLQVVWECTCGCRSVGLGPVANSRTSSAEGSMVGMIGDLYIQTAEGKSIEILLHANKGRLVELEVICNANSEPIPAAWQEVARHFLTK